MATDFTNELSLDDLIEEANEDFPNLIVDGVTFLNPMQMEKEQRDAFQEIIKREQDTEEDEDGAEDGEDSFDFIRAVLTVAANDEVRAEALLDRIGDNGAVLVTLSKRYFELNRVGEA